MNEKIALTSSELYENLLQREPKVISLTVPDNATEAKDEFLKDQRYLPEHTYSKMDAVTDDMPESIRQIGASFGRRTDLNDATKRVYEEFAENYARKTEMLLSMNSYRHANSEEDKAAAAQEFMSWNVDLYGEPDKQTYVSLVGDALSKAKDLDAESHAAVYAQEVMESLGINWSEAESGERFIPSNDTVEWMHTAVHELYGGFLQHLPRQDSLSILELQASWLAILKNEFGGAADDWEVVIEPAKSINVRASEKKIIIPEDRGDIDLRTAQKLTVHEIGVHAFRSVTGASTDIHPLANGLVNYYDAEEGLGMVMEQAYMGEYREAGVPHYITAGMAYFNNLDFRQIFEARWRINAISGADESGHVSEEKINAARTSAYGQTMRILRGTDSLPWFKDLAYYNGAIEVWKYLEENRGDEFALSLLLQGKRNTSREHQNIILESRTI